MNASATEAFHSSVSSIQSAASEYFPLPRIMIFPIVKRIVKTLRAVGECLTMRLKVFCENRW